MIKRYKLEMNMNGRMLYGMMQLNIEGNMVSGNFECNQIKGHFDNGTIQKNQIMFSGRIKVFLLTVNYTAQGTIEQDQIAIDIDSNKGKYKITGIEC